LEVEGSHPAAYGFAPGPAPSRRVLLYAHHDVQPPGPLEFWESTPFEPTERGGRLCGRGIAHDKAGIAAHAAALQAWRGAPPLDVATLIEGEEETCSTHLPEFVSMHKDLLRADVVAAADCSNWAIRPMLHRLPPEQHPRLYRAVFGALPGPQPRGRERG
jgi:cysteinylglycine-S-conjugate dipeptidase